MSDEHGQHDHLHAADHRDHDGHACCGHEHHAGDAHDHHGHHHHHPLPTSAGRLAAVTLLNLIITAAEFIGGIIGGSLALVSDAVHNLSDGLAIVLAWVAARMASHPSDARHTFGWRRAEILAAFINGLFLAGVAVFLLVEAGRRWMNPVPIQGTLVLVVAIIGLLANLIGAGLLFRDKGHSLNIRASYLHLLSDTLSSVVVVVGGLLFMVGVDTRLDAILTAALSVYMLYQGIMLLRQCTLILLNVSPEIDLSALEREISGIRGVKGLHHVHIWQMDDRDVHFEAHIEVEDMPVSDAENLTGVIRELLETRFGISHTILQFETVCCKNAGLIVDCRTR